MFCDAADVLGGAVEAPGPAELPDLVGPSINKHGEHFGEALFGDRAGNVHELCLGLFIDGLVYEGAGILAGEDGRGVVDEVVDLREVDVVLAIGADGAFVDLGYDGAGIFGGLAFAPEVGAEAAETVSIGWRYNS